MKSIALGLLSLAFCHSVLGNEKDYSYKNRGRDWTLTCASVSII